MWKDRREKLVRPLYRSVVSGLLHVQPFCGSSSTELQKLERRGMSREIPSSRVGD